MSNLEHHGMICGCPSCLKLKGGASDVVLGVVLKPNQDKD